MQLMRSGFLIRPRLRFGLSAVLSTQEFLDWGGA